MQDEFETIISDLSLRLDRLLENGKISHQEYESLMSELANIYHDEYSFLDLTEKIE